MSAWLGGEPGLQTQRSQGVLQLPRLGTLQHPRETETSQTPLKVKRSQCTARLSCSSVGQQEVGALSSWSPGNKSVTFPLCHLPGWHLAISQLCTFSLAPLRTDSPLLLCWQGSPTGPT